MRFSERMWTGNGTMRLIEYVSKELVKVQYASNTSAVTVNGSAIVFSFPSGLLDYTKWYTVDIDPWAFTDYAGLGSKILA